jgi:lysozyme
MPQTISTNGVNFIKQWESFNAKAFWDYKQWSIGYGTKAKDGTEVIDEKEACVRLEQETKKAQDAVHKYVTTPLTQNMFDALVSFTYNVGVSWLVNGSNTLNYLNSGNKIKAASALLNWNKAGGIINRGLCNRRAAERELFLK